MTEKKKKYFVRKPSRGKNGWEVVVAEDRSPLSKVIERVPFGSRTEAHTGYARIKREIGDWL